MFFTEDGVPILFAKKKGDWWGDIIATDPILAEDGKTIVGFKTYQWADEAVKAGAIALYIGDAKKGKSGFAGMYLSKDK
jgi:hypothetical protein